MNMMEKTYDVWRRRLQGMPHFRKQPRHLAAQTVGCWMDVLGGKPMENPWKTHGKPMGYPYFKKPAWVTIVCHPGKKSLMLRLATIEGHWFRVWTCTNPKKVSIPIAIPFIGGVPHQVVYVDQLIRVILPFQKCIWLGSLLPGYPSGWIWFSSDIDMSLTFYVSTPVLRDSLTISQNSFKGFFSHHIHPFLAGNLGYFSMLSFLVFFPNRKPTNGHSQSILAHWAPKGLIGRPSINRWLWAIEKP